MQDYQSGWGFMWEFHGFGWLFMVLLFGLFVWFVIAVLRRIFSPPGPVVRDDPALAILRERYARGDITDEEYQRKRKELSQPPP